MSGRNRCAATLRKAIVRNAQSCELCCRHRAKARTEGRAGSEIIFRVIAAEKSAAAFRLAAELAALNQGRAP